MAIYTHSDMLSEKIREYEEMISNDELDFEKATVALDTILELQAEGVKEVVSSISEPKSIDEIDLEELVEEYVDMIAREDDSSYPDNVASLDLDAITEEVQSELMENSVECEDWFVVDRSYDFDFDLIETTVVDFDAIEMLVRDIMSER